MKGEPAFYYYSFFCLEETKRELVRGGVRKKSLASSASHCSLRRGSEAGGFSAKRVFSR